MAKSIASKQRDKLIQRAKRFLNHEGSAHAPLSQILDTIYSRGWEMAIFGGTLRDLMVFGSAMKPRDIDIVIGHTKSNDLYEALATFVKRRTRFGGLHLFNSGWLVDVWPIEETWAMRHSLVSAADFSELPKTTFLDVEAVALYLDPKTGKFRLYSNGFFEAISRRLININLEDNPYPALCVVRSLITAKRLGFDLGSNLAAYISHYMRNIDVEEMEHAQMSHYHTIYLDRNRLRFLQQSIEEQLRSSTDRITLPGATIRQLSLWEGEGLPDILLGLDSGTRLAKSTRVNVSRTSSMTIPKEISKLWQIQLLTQEPYQKRSPVFKSHK